MKNDNPKNQYCPHCGEKLVQSDNPQEELAEALSDDNFNEEQDEKKADQKKSKK